MLAGAGFGDHPRFTHPQRQQSLAQRVIDLVRTGMVQILAFEPNSSAANRFGQPASVIKRAGATDKGFQQTVEFAGKLGVVLRFVVFPGKLIQSPRQGLRYETTTKTAESPAIIGNGRGGG